MAHSLLEELLELYTKRLCCGVDDPWDLSIARQIASSQLSQPDQLVVWKSSHLALHAGGAD